MKYNVSTPLQAIQILSLVRELSSRCLNCDETLYLVFHLVMSSITLSHVQSCRFRLLQQKTGKRIIHGKGNVLSISELRYDDSIIFSLYILLYDFSKALCTVCKIFVALKEYAKLHSDTLFSFVLTAAFFVSSINIIIQSGMKIFK